MSLDTARYMALRQVWTNRLKLGFQAGPAVYPKLAQTLNSTKPYEDYSWLGDVPIVRELVGERIYDQVRAANFQVVNKEYQLNMRIKKTDVEDDNVGFYSDMASALGMQFKQHPDELMLDAIENGHQRLCFDGQYFYDTDHSWGDSGTQSNKLSHAAATGTAPTATEFKDAHGEAVEAILGFTADSGKKLFRGAVGSLNNLVTIVPLGMRQEAAEALGATVLNNNSNVVLDKPDLQCWPALTDAASFYVCWSGGPIKPFVFQDRRKIGEALKNDPEDGYLKWLLDARYAVGYLAWFYSVKMTFT